MDEDPVASEATIGDDVIRTNISDCNCINKSKIINIILNGENLINKNFVPFKSWIPYLSNESCLELLQYNK